jgi:hypothetical protein
MGTLHGEITWQKNPFVNKPVQVSDEAERRLEVFLHAEEVGSDVAKGLEDVEDEQGPPADYVDDDDGNEHADDLNTIQ